MEKSLNFIAQFLYEPCIMQPGSSFCDENAERMVTKLALGVALFITGMSCVGKTYWGYKQDSLM